MAHISKKSYLESYFLSALTVFYSKKVKSESEPLQTYNKRSSKAHVNLWQVSGLMSTGLEPEVGIHLFIPRGIPMTQHSRNAFISQGNPGNHPVSYFIHLIKIYLLRLERWLSREDLLLFLAPTWKLTIISNYTSRGSESFFCPSWVPGTHVV